MQKVAFEIALFPKNLSLDNPSGLISEIAKAVENKGIKLENQNIFPLNFTNLNSNMPRLIASSNDESVIFQANKSKLNFTVQQVGSKELMPEDSFLALAEEILNRPILRNLEFKRLGYIRTHLIEVEDFAPYAKVILAQEWQENIQNFNMQLDYRGKHEELNLNIVLKIASVFDKTTGAKKVQLQTDVNTLDDQDASVLGVPLGLLKKLSNDTLASKYLKPLEEKGN